MPYLLSLVIALAAAGAYLGSINRRLNIKADPVRTFLPLGMGIGALLMMSPLIATLAAGDALELSAGLLPIILGVVGALIAMTTGILGITRSEGSPIRSMQAHAGAWLVLAAIVPMVSYASHLEFVFGGGEGVQAGYLNVGLLPEQETGAICHRGVVLMRWDESRTTPVEYRCPKSIVLQQQTSVPLLPWPSYDSGNSLRLAEVLHAMMRNAVKPAN